MSLKNESYHVQYVHFIFFKFVPCTLGDSFIGENLWSKYICRIADSKPILIEKPEEIIFKKNQI
jgi:hypothetical protein